MRPEPIILAVTLSFSNCAGQSSTEKVLVGTVQKEATALTIQQVFTEAVSGVTTRRRLVIREVERWVEFWVETMGKRTQLPEAPSLDFDRYMVIAAAMGARPTGGYAISIEDVRRRQGQLVVMVREMSPGPGCVTTQAFSAPVTAVRVPRTDAPMAFVERQESYTCGR